MIFKKSALFVFLLVSVQPAVHGVPPFAYGMGADAGQRFGLEATKLIIAAISEGYLRLSVDALACYTGVATAGTAAMALVATNCAAAQATVAAGAAATVAVVTSPPVIIGAGVAGSSYAAYKVYRHYRPTKAQQMEVLKQEVALTELQVRIKKGNERLHEATVIAPMKAQLQELTLQEQLAKKLQQLAERRGRVRSEPVLGII